MSETTQAQWDRLLAAAWGLIEADSAHMRALGQADDNTLSRLLYRIEEALNELELAAAECGPVPESVKIRLPEGVTVTGLDEKWIAR